VKNGSHDEIEKLVVLDFVMATQASEFYFKMLWTHPVKKGFT